LRAAEVLWRAAVTPLQSGRGKGKVCVKEREESARHHGAVDTMVLQRIISSMRAMRGTNCVKTIRTYAVDPRDHAEIEMAEFLTSLKEHGHITEFVISLGGGPVIMHARFFSTNKHKYMLSVTSTEMTLTSGFDTGLFFHGFDAIIGTTSYVARFRADWRLSHATTITTLWVLQQRGIHTELREIIYRYLERVGVATGLLSVQVNFGGLCCQFFPPDPLDSDDFTFMPEQFENS
jgi:hypothetical protein